MLHISFDEQRERFLRRLRRDDKRWKFSEADLETRRYWNAFQTAYGNAIARTTSDTAPWYVIPADHKWYRNWAIAKLLLATFDSMGATYPQPDFYLTDLRARLAPPN
jgi:polyphosphate kinase 2 (PPK2 family)